MHWFIIVDLNSTTEQQWKWDLYFDRLSGSVNRCTTWKTDWCWMRKVHRQQDKIHTKYQVSRGEATSEWKPGVDSKQANKVKKQGPGNREKVQWSRQGSGKQTNRVKGWNANAGKPSISDEERVVVGWCTHCMVMRGWGSGYCRDGGSGRLWNERPVSGKVRNNRNVMNDQKVRVRVRFISGVWDQVWCFCLYNQTYVGHLISFTTMSKQHSLPRKVGPPQGFFWTFFVAQSHILQGSD